jgi:translocation and assembly module TamB
MRAATALRPLALLLVMALAGLAWTGSGRAQEDQGVIAGLVSRVLSTPTSRVSIGAVEGALSSDVTIRNISVADPQGVFLEVDRLRLTWRRAALLSRRIEIQRLEIGRVVFRRQPQGNEGAPAPDGPLLPELPLKVQVDAFTLAELVLGPTLLRQEANASPTRVSASGNASLGPPAEGLLAALDIRRLDAAGSAALRLGFVPQGERLDLALRLEEPAGGIVARLANLPGLPPVQLDVSGSGVLDDWRGALQLDAGPGIAARGDARLERQGAQRRLGLALTARVDALLPPAAADVFAGDTRVGGAILFRDDGGFGIERLTLTSALAELTVNGGLSADRQLDVSVRARGLPNAGDALRRGETSLSRLVFDGRAVGPATRPRVEGTLDVAGLVAPAYRLQALQAQLVLEPGDTPAALYRLTGDATASGLVPADAGLAAALGNTARVTLRGSVGEDGVATLGEASVTTPTLRAGYEGRIGAALVDGRLALTMERLAPLSTLAGRPLEGNLVLAAALSGDPSARRIVAGLDGRATRLRLGLPAADRLTGGALTLAGEVQTAPGSISFRDLALSGQHVTARLAGQLATDTLRLDGNVSLPTLARLDERLAGAARLDLALSGGTAEPQGSLTLTAPEARSLGRPIRDLVLSISGTRLLTLPEVTLAGRGSIGGESLTLDGRVQADSDGGWRSERVLARLGSVLAEVSGRLSAAGRLDGRVQVQAGNLDDLSPLVAQRLAGSLNADVQASDANGQQRLAGTLQARGVRGEGFSLETADGTFSAENVFGRLALAGDVRATGLRAGGQTVERLTLNARPEGADNALTVTADAAGFQLAGAGRLGAAEAAGQYRLALASFSARRNGRSIVLAQPATLLIADGGASTERLTLRVNGGEVSIRGRLGSTLDATVEARALPLSAAEVFVPGLGLAGTLDGRATLTGPAAAPRGPYQLTLRGLSLPALRNAGVPPLTVASEGELRGERASTRTTITGQRGIALTLTGEVPLSPAGALDLAARGTLDLALANPLLAGGGQRVAGRVTVDATIRGSAGQPDIAGTATLSGGSIADPLRGVALTGIEGRISGRGNALVVERLAARTLNGGTVSLTGRVTADPAAGFPADLRLTATGAELVNSGLARLVASLNLAITGPLASAPRLAGRVEVESLDVRVPDRLPSASEPLRNARHIAPPPSTRARLAQLARQDRAASRGRGRAPAPFNAALDVLVDAPSRVFVRGRGIDAELGGQVRISGSTQAPAVNGAFDLRRGRLAVLTQRLDFTRGRLTFAGDLLPELDFVAETRAGDVTARVLVTGPANQPAIAFTSEPFLPPDEVLSRLLFARAAGGLSPFQALQLAQAAAQLSGAGDGPDAFEATRRALGVDDLDVGLGEGGPTVGLSRAISNNIRLGVRAGARPEDTGVGATIDVTRRLKIQTEVGVDGRASVGVGTEIEY